MEVRSNGLDDSFKLNQKYYKLLFFDSLVHPFIAVPFIALPFLFLCSRLFQLQSSLVTTVSLFPKRHQKTPDTMVAESMKQKNTTFVRMMFEVFCFYETLCKIKKLTYELMYQGIQTVMWTTKRICDCRTKNGV